MISQNFPVSFNQISHTGETVFFKNCFQHRVGVVSISDYSQQNTMYSMYSTVCMYVCMFFSKDDVIQYNMIPCV